MDQLRRLLLKRSEAVGLLAALVAVVAIANLQGGGRTSGGLYVAGLVTGAVVALHAVGIVLVHRANRVINFAQIQMGVFASTFFYEMTSRRLLVRGLAAVCPPCVREPRTLGEIYDALGSRSQRVFGDLPTLSAADRRIPAESLDLPTGVSLRDFAIEGAPRWMVHANFWISLVLAVLLAALLVWIVYLLIVSRFRSAPRLVLTVVTIASGALVQVLGGWLLSKVSGGESGRRVYRHGDGKLLYRQTNEVGGVVFGWADALTVLVLVLVAVALAVYFKRSRMGIVMRGAAENPQRAQTLGVNVNSVTSRAWMLAGLLSGLASVLSVAKYGTGEGAGVDTLVRVLAAAVCGGLVGVPLAVAGGVVVGVMDQLVLDVAGDRAVVDGVVVVFVVGLLLAQRARATRADIESQSSWLASRELRPIPDELRHLPQVKRAVRLLAFVGLVITLGYPWFMSPGQTTLGTNTMCVAIVALSLLVLTGWAGQISLAQMGFAAIGAWVAAASGLPFVLALPAAGVAGAAIAALVGVPALRLRGQHLAISTLALSVAISSLVIGPKYLGAKLPSGLERPVFLGVNLEDDRAFYYLTLVLLGAAIAATMGMRRSRTARALIASKDNEQAAQGFGIGLLRARITAFAISGFMAAFAGALLAYTQHGVEPGSFAPGASVDLFLVTLIGGLGSVAGPVIGAVYFGMLEVLRGTGFAQIAVLLLDPAVGILALLAFAPGGLSRIVWSVRDAWLRRLADRHRIVVPSLIADRATLGATLPVKPKLGPTGVPATIPPRYRLDEQWMDEHRVRERTKAIEAASRA